MNDVAAPNLWTSEHRKDLPRVSIAWVSSPYPGEAENGDAVCVRELGTSILVAVVDALGHGDQAARVAQTSIEWLRAAEGGATTASLVDGLHGTLKNSRGAAALVMTLSSKGIEACSVGNVTLRSHTGKVSFVLTPGVLGVRMRGPKVCGSPSMTDRLVLFTDGISSRFDIHALRGQSTSDAASHIFKKHRHLHDDSTVVVVDIA